MNGRAFLASARLVLAAGGEANWRTVAGRAYYAVLHECRTALAGWGFPLPASESIHRFVQVRLAWPANPDLRGVGGMFDRLATLRNAADYDLSTSGPFSNATRASRALHEAEDAIALLDAIGADSARLAAAVAALRAAFP